MLSIEDIQKQCITEEATVQIESWNGEVKIRQLTVSETADVVATQAKGDRAMSSVKMASYGLVEPRMTVKKLLALPAGAFDGIAEVVTAISDLEEPKK